MRVRVEQLSFTYPGGIQALKDVSLELESGQTVAILGENGAGKTTLARTFNGLLQPSQGQVIIGDWKTDEHSVAQLSSRVGYVFQNPDDQLFAQTVEAEVAFGPKNLGWPPGEVREAVDGALAQTSLTGAASRHPYDLSASERRFVALASSLAMRTPILVMDEPTTGLDASGVARVAEIVAQLHRRAVTVCIISHDLDFCAEHAERAVVMADGRIAAVGPVGEIFHQDRLLRESRLVAPQLTRLAQALGMPAGSADVDSFVAAYSRRQRPHE